MSEYKDLLERIGDRAPMPEPAFDRMVHRQERRRRNRRISAGVVGVLVTAVLVLALASSRRVAAPQPLKPTPAGSNGRIAYSLAGKGIYLVTEGQQPRLVIGTPDDDAVERCPAFSPDGTHLAFTRQGATGTIRTFVADVGEAGIIGDSERFVVTSKGEYWACPEWAPDSNGLLYTNNQGLWIVGTETHESPIRIAPFPDLVDAGWSPDGSIVAAVSRDGDVFVVSVRDGTLITRAKGPTSASLSWSPNGDRIAVGQGNTGDLSPVLLINVQNGESQELTASGRSFVGYGNPIWSSDGTSIALRDQHEADNGIVIVRLDDDSWYRIPIPTLDPPDVWALRWSPDGQQLLAASGCSVYSIPADGSGQPLLVSSADVDAQRCQLPPGIDWQGVPR